MAIALVDGIVVEFDERENLNGIQLARRAGVEIPHYCWHPGLSVVASCRMCLVEIGFRNAVTGEVRLLPKLVAACNTPAQDGLVLVTQSAKVQQARAMVQEDLLLRHPVDCPICDKAGECLLQDYYYRYGHRQRRAPWGPFTSRRKDIGEKITLFVDRCIMCSRCVRFTREISGTAELMIVDRGNHQEIDIFPGFPINNKLSGNVVDLCPVGALGDKEFLYKQRVWYLTSHPSVCVQCATGCSIWVDENQDRIWRLRPRENPFVNKWWMCNDGRYAYPYVHSPQRLVGARRKAPDGWCDLDWSSLVEELRQFLEQKERLAAVVSPFLTVEEAYLLCRAIRQVDPRAPLVLGDVPQVGEDERFPGGFAIAREKCPNRRGVEEVIAHFIGRVPPVEELPELVRRHGAQAVWLSGEYPQGWAKLEWLPALAELGVALIVHDLFPSALCDRAEFVVGAPAFAEKAGSYVNRHDRLQSVPAAIRPPKGVFPAGRLLWRLLGQEGTYEPASVLQEVARNISYFRAALGTIPPVGVDLKVNLLAVAENGTVNDLGTESLMIG
ncbi:MAG: 2Fe-2S iron-sulfur cluster-binding protein [Thermoguttaceae bacterium]|nr:2Fe-2S iron-sulfur cluster-binding protein [Thermoguttaceae bacterium]MDW8079605.1 2Fe-2S iron-sulfur cluster-binding protein [Thermoguttaceae bacterium]